MATPKKIKGSVNMAPGKMKMMARATSNTAAFEASMNDARARGMMPAPPKTGLDRVTDFVRGNARQVTGKTATPISRAMKKKRQ